MQKKALEGLRVIEYAQGIGVPYAGKLMADLGAEVIKIESPGTGDSARHLGPFVGGEAHSEKSCVFLYANSNKKSITLSLEDPRGAEIFKRLTASADVLLREGDPDWFEERGLGYEELSRENPMLILSSSTPFGESGPYRNHAHSPNTLAHMSGGTVLYPHGTGDGHRAPVMLGGNFEEYDTGSVLLVGILAALHWRRRAGRGQYIETASLEARFQMLTTEAVLYPVFRQSYNREGTIQRMQSSLSFPCKDGYLCPFLSQQKEFNALARLLGREDWLEEEWFNDITQRRARADEIAEVMQEWAKSYTKKEATRLVQEARIPIGPVETPADVVESPQFNERGFFTTVQHPVCGELKMPGRPFIMEKTPHSYERSAPTLGQDNTDVLGGLLGLSEDEQGHLAADNVI